MWLTQRNGYYRLNERLPVNLSSTEDSLRKCSLLILKSFDSPLMRSGTNAGKVYFFNLIKVLLAETWLDFLLPGVFLWALFYTIKECQLGRHFSKSPAQCNLRVHSEIELCLPQLQLLGPTETALKGKEVSGQKKSQMVWTSWTGPSVANSHSG